MTPLRVCVIGVGLIGGSFARALRLSVPDLEIIGCGRSEDNLQRALDLGVIDRYHTDVGKAVSAVDVILVAVPLGAMKTVFLDIAQYASEQVVITDVGSSKQSVLADAVTALGALTCRFVAGHPIAGTEHSGVDASFPELFRDRQVVLTPLPDTDKDAVNIVRELWQKTGAEVNIMDAEHHDTILAATSHMPHILAFNLVNTLSDIDTSGEVFRYAAGGFQDFSRIASSDPVVWRDICLSNGAAMLDVLNHFSQDLEQLQGHIANADGDALLALFTRAKQTRDDYLKKQKQNKRGVD
ncbi:MAG: prephenate dehydrogenase/arogenate dehydrogenase family protein [Gammaproteobacteria bacterium]|nr:prephenate dehydrogenase/arogenate dehydrogenase family protein [Gammaproteobacteria bacterium]